MHSDLTGRTALVCASTAGLGFACADALVSRGVDVIINGRNRAALERAASRLRNRARGTVQTIVADLNSARDRAALAGAAANADILVNNNGGPPSIEVVDMKREDITRALESNMLVAIELMQALVPGMAARGFGRVVNITSIAVDVPLRTLAASGAARAALSSFSLALARQYAPKNVVINSIEPGFFATDRLMQVTAGSKQGNLEAIEKQFSMKVPAARLGRPEELGELCAYLCSQAGYVTGQRIRIDGGFVPCF